MIGGGFGGSNPFEMLHNLVQQQSQGPGNFFEALAGEAREAVMRAREVSAGTTPTAAIGTDHLLAGIVTGDNLGVEALRRVGANVDGMRTSFGESRGDPGDQIYTFTPSAKRALQIAFTAARQMGSAQVGSEHLLLGLLGEGDGNACQILARNGANDAEALRREIARLLQQRGQMGPGAVPGGGGGGFGPGGPGGPGGGGFGGPGGFGGQGGTQGQESRTPTLDQVTRNLTEAARNGELDPVMGRAEEIARVVRILSRRTKNNPALIGEPGVGKTAIVEGLARGSSPTRCPRRSRTSECSPRHRRSGRRHPLPRRLRGADEPDDQGAAVRREEHNPVHRRAAHASSGPAEPRGRERLEHAKAGAGARRASGHRRYHARRVPQARREGPGAGAPLPARARERADGGRVRGILFGLRDRYEAHHRCVISDEAIFAAAQLGDRYITDRYLPDKAIDLLDEAAAEVRLRSTVPPVDVKRIEEEIAGLEREKEDAVRAEDYEQAAGIKQRIEQLKTELDQQQQGWAGARESNAPEVTPEDIARILEEWTGVPATNIVQEEAERLLNLEAVLHERVIGQERAVKAVAEAVRRARAGIKDPDRPVGSFIFSGRPESGRRSSRGRSPNTSSAIRTP
jgi:ATP-dependent Clp protease ATP-binding subunit ClpC